MADLKKALEKIKADKNLKTEFSKAVKEDKVVEFLKGLGVVTTKKEVADFIKSNKKELSDDELNVVSGGCSTSSIGWDILITVVGLGIYCAINSLCEVADGTCLEGDA